MIHCIIGAIALCQANAAMQIDGPLRYAASYPASGAWNYAVYARPVLQPTPTYILPRRA